MYLRITERRNKDGSTVAYYALAENVWNAKAKRSEARVIHSFGRADRLDWEALKRLVHSINRVLETGGAEPAGTPRPPEIERVYDWVSSWPPAISGTTWGSERRSGPGERCRAGRAPRGRPVRHDGPAA
jgi:hypothetical protein